MIPNPEPLVALNLHTGSLHRYGNPKIEACNLDAVRQAGNLAEFMTDHDARQHPRFKRNCFRCYRAQPVPVPES